MVIILVSFNQIKDKVSGFIDLEMVITMKESGLTAWEVGMVAYILN